MLQQKIRNRAFYGALALVLAGVCAQGVAAAAAQEQQGDLQCAKYDFKIQCDAWFPGLRGFPSLFKMSMLREFLAKEGWASRWWKGTGSGTRMYPANSDVIGYYAKDNGKQVLRLMKVYAKSEYLERGGSFVGSLLSAGMAGYMGYLLRQGFSSNEPMKQSNFYILGGMMLICSVAACALFKDSLPWLMLKKVSSSISPEILDAAGYESNNNELLEYPWFNQELAKAMDAKLKKKGSEEYNGRYCLGCESTQHPEKHFVNFLTPNQTGTFKIVSARKDDIMEHGVQKEGGTKIIINVHGS